MYATCLSFAFSLMSASDIVLVEDATHGCYLAEEQSYTWVADGGVYRCDGRELSRDQIDALRSLVLACRSEPDDLLTQVGLIPEELKRHRDEAVHAAMARVWRKEGAESPQVPAELTYLFEWDYIAPHLLAELRGSNWFSTTSSTFAVTLPGEPPVRVESNALVPWMLPWTITVGGESWKVADASLSAALLPLADPDGPCAPLLDGTDYWTNGIWQDERFWSRFVGSRLDAALSTEKYTKLAGWERFNQRFRVDDATTGSVNLQPESIFIELSALFPSPIDEARWHNVLKEGEPGFDWNDLLGVYDGAAAAVVREGWLLDWRHAGPQRTIGLEVLGRSGFAGNMFTQLMLAAWSDAGFQVEPDFHLLLRRGRRWCGTVYLSADQPGALIEIAKPGDDGGTHWFDGLDFSYHPRGEPPTYGLVDASGTVQVRTME